MTCTERDGEGRGRSPHHVICTAAADGVLAVQVTSSRTFDRHTHDAYGVGVVEAGGHRSISGRGPVEAGPGDVITVNPGEVHDGAPAGDARRWRILYFEPRHVASAWAGVAATGHTPCEFTTPALAERPVGRRVRRLFDAYSSQTPEALAAREPLLLAVLARLCGPVTGGAPEIRTRHHLRRARQMIDDDPATPRDLATLGEAEGLSRYQVLRAFVRATGLTPHAYQTQRRLESAAGLIRRGGALADIALATGFADQSHMTRAFVRRFGYTPGALARAVAVEPEAS